MCKASEILYGSRIGYIKYVYEILFIAATAQIETLKNGGYVRRSLIRCISVDSVSVTSFAANLAVYV